MPKQPKKKEEAKKEAKQPVPPAPAQPKPPAPSVDKPEDKAASSSQTTDNEPKDKAPKDGKEVNPSKALIQQHNAERPQATDSRGVKPGTKRGPYNKDGKSTTRPKDTDKPPMTEADKEAALETSAGMAADAQLGLFAGLFGDKWKDGGTGRDKGRDVTIVKTGWKAYFRGMGWYEMPPVVALILAQAAYITPRLDFAWFWKRLREKMEARKNGGKVVDEKPKAEAKPEGEPMKEAA